MNDLKSLENKRPVSNGFAIGFNVVITQGDYIDGCIDRPTSCFVVQSTFSSIILVLTASIPSSLPRFK